MKTFALKKAVNRLEKKKSELKEEERPSSSSSQPSVISINWSDVILFSLDIKVSLRRASW